MSRIQITVVLLAGLLASCTAPERVPPPNPATPPPMVGADRDAHGCIPSAGYAWCQHTQRCERPWELANQYNIANSADGFSHFCGHP